MKFKLKNDTSSFLKNSVWSLIGTVISKGLMFLAWMFVANTLGKTVNGEIGVLRSTLSLFISLIGTGFGVTLTKFLPKHRFSDSEKVNKIISLTFLSSVILGLIISFFYFFLSPWLANDILLAPHLLFVIRLNTVLLFFSILNGVALGFLQGFEKFKELVLVNTVFGVILFVSLYVGAIKYQIEGVFSGFILATIVGLIVSLYYIIQVFKEHSITLTNNFFGEIWIIKHFTIPAILSGVAVIPFKWGLETLLVRQEQGYSEMGLFAAIFLFHNLLLMGVNTLNAPLIISMTKNQNNKKIGQINLILPWVIGFIAMLPVLFFPNILGVFLKADYINDENFNYTTYMVAIITILVLFKNGMSRIMIVHDLMWFSFVSNLIWGLTLVSTFFFIEIKNAVTMALSYVLAYLINILIVIPVYVRKKIIPLNIIYSKWAILVWCIFLLVIFIVFSSFVLDIYLKIIFLSLCLFSVMFSFYKILDNEK